MSTDALYKPQRRKPNIFGWLAGTLVILALAFVYQLFGPNAPIISSPQTTYITEPLAADGLPDYEKHLLELYRRNVAPEENAAVLIFQASWPANSSTPLSAAIAQELKIKTMPAPQKMLRGFFNDENKQQLALLLGWRPEVDDPRSASLDELPIEDPEAEDDESNTNYLYYPDSSPVNDSLWQATSRPWTTKQLPFLARWVNENKQPLDLLVEASRRPKCYLPSPSLLDNQHQILIEMDRLGLCIIRDAHYELSVRAMWHLGESEFDKAWQDILALHRLARLTAQGPALIDQLFAFVIERTASEDTLALLSHVQLTSKQAQQIQSDLASLSKFDRVANAFDSGERMIFLDSMTRHRGAVEDDGSAYNLPFSDYFSVNWNVACRQGNDYFDRLSAAARLPTREARQQAFSAIYAEDALRSVSDQRAISAAIINPLARNEIAATIVLSYFLAPLKACEARQDEANARLDLLNTAAAIAVYRAEHGEYPVKLDELIPNPLGTMPIDLYSASPFAYRKTDDGYLLYSFGENGVDDGGSNRAWMSLEGQDYELFSAKEQENLEEQIPSGADDLSIRLPRPHFELPQARQE